MQRLTALLDDALARHIGSAVALSIGDGGREVGRVVRGHMQRVPDLGPPIDDTVLFDLASVTKPMSTVACAMVLVGDGKLDLDAPIARWIPTAASTGTIRQLLGHSAGCIAHVEFFKTMRVGEHPDPRGELLALAAAVPANPPGLATVYSDLGFIQMGAIVERAAGMPLEQAFAELVAGPLNLTARFAGTSPLPNAVATEITDWRGLVSGLVHDENCFYGGGIAGHAGLFSTLGDVATFARAIVETWAGSPRGRFRQDVVQRFAADAPLATTRSGTPDSRALRSGSISRAGAGLSFSPIASIRRAEGRVPTT